MFWAVHRLRLEHLGEIPVDRRVNHSLALPDEELSAGGVSDGDDECDPLLPGEVDPHVFPVAAFGVEAADLVSNDVDVVQEAVCGAVVGPLVEETPFGRILDYHFDLRHFLQWQLFLGQSE